MVNKFPMTGKWDISQLFIKNERRTNMKITEEL
jgi:hypothetical protein